MVRSSRDYFGRRRETYYQSTHRPLNCLLFLLPLIVAYELGSFVVGDVHLSPDHAPPQRVIAFFYLVRFLGLFSSMPTYLPGPLLVVILLVWHIARGDRWKVRWSSLGGMWLESLLLWLPLLMLSKLFHRFSQATLIVGGEAGWSVGERLIIALTAGLYEELIFRLLLIGVIRMLLVDILELPRAASLAAAVVAAALLFSGYHYLGSETFAWSTFCFRAVAGLYLGVLYVLRGFGITVGAHAAYDVVVMLALSS